jgi:membrane protease YdiL (CAAX protease family)
MLGLPAAGRYLPEARRRAMHAAATGGKAWRAAEFAAIFVVAPVVMAVALPPSAMFPALFALTAVGLVLLAATPGFSWRELVRGRIRWGEVAAFALVTAAAAWAVVTLTAPEAAFFLVRHNPGLLLLILVLYPLLSALPQELVFRPLFFRRYGALLPAGPAALWLNAAAFAWAHLLFWNWIVAAMTFAGGFVFAHAYRVRGSFPQAVVMHAVAGNILFAFGLGIFFYTGNIARPF